MYLVDLVGIQVDPKTGASVLVLREHDAPNRLLPIIVGGPEAASIAIAASGQTAPRPMTHDLMATLIESFDGHLDAVEVTDLKDGSFVANLAVSGPAGERRLDTRPSDGIALAVRLDAPLFVSEHVLDEVGTLPIVELDEVAIDAEVDQFRSFLAELDPADFDDEADDETTPAATNQENEADDEAAPAADGQDSETEDDTTPAAKDQDSETGDRDNEPED
ncbi:MAG: bifunctional nuclease family protein [Actinobacteria bacterium]|nr:MAG: bifunctional nuclease family protein [Actinomycetota bacterium]